jgi:CRP/FNR family transcriptional regulator
MQQSSVISVSEDELIELVASQPASAVDVIGNISRRLTESQVLIEDLMNNSVDLRLHRTLQELARQFGRRDAVGGAVVIDIPLTHQRLADMIGSNRVTVSRKLHVLQERGIVGSRGVGTVVILDLPKLDQLAVNTGE